MKKDFAINEEDFVLFVGDYYSKKIKKYMKKIFTNPKKLNKVSALELCGCEKQSILFTAFNNYSSLNTDDIFIHSKYVFNKYTEKFDDLFSLHDDDINYLFEKLYLNFGIDNQIFMEMANELSFNLILYDKKKQDFFLVNGNNAEDNKLYCNVKDDNIIISNNYFLIKSLCHNVYEFKSNCYLKNKEVHFWDNQKETINDKIAEADNSFKLFFYLLKQKINSCIQQHKLECQINDFDLSGLIADIIAIVKHSQNYKVVYNTDYEDFDDPETCHINIFDQAQNKIIQIHADYKSMDSEEEEETIKTPQHDNLFVAHKIIENAFQICINKRKTFIDVSDFVASIIQCEYLNLELRTKNGIEIFDKWYNKDNETTKLKIKLKTK